MFPQDIFDITAHVYAEKPQKDIHSFVGTFTRVRTPLLFFTFYISHVNVGDLALQDAKNDAS